MSVYTLQKLINWLNSERYLIDNKSSIMTEIFENEHKWELSRNRMIDKTVNHIHSLIKAEYPCEHCNLMKCNNTYDMLNIKPKVVTIICPKCGKEHKFDI